uniref:Uncharacterized protein n=1 Tax=Anopheles arabiensis TaxID=7173 RepID=A0A182IHB4_ANOAR
AFRSCGDHCVFNQWGQGGLESTKYSDTFVHRFIWLPLGHLRVCAQRTRPAPHSRPHSSHASTETCQRARDARMTLWRR